jgi:hypothetical protein
MTGTSHGWLMTHLFVIELQLEELAIFVFFWKYKQTNIWASSGQNLKRIQCHLVNTIKHQINSTINYFLLHSVSLLEWFYSLDKSLAGEVVTSEQFNNKEYKQVIIDSSEKFPRPFNNHIRIERFQPFLFGSLFQVVDSTPKFVVTQFSYIVFSTMLYGIRKRLSSKSQILNWRATPAVIVR